MAIPKSPTFRGSPLVNLPCGTRALWQLGKKRSGNQRTWPAPNSFQHAGKVPALLGDLVESASFSRAKGTPALYRSKPQTTFCPRSRDVENPPNETSPSVTNRVIPTPWPNHCLNVPNTHCLNLFLLVRVLRSTSIWLFQPLAQHPPHPTITLSVIPKK